MKTKKPRKPPTLARLKKILQGHFNQFIRLRDCGGRGYARCISCSKILTYEQTQAGHFWSVGAYPELRFDERNVHVQGACCNTFRHGNLLEYQIGLIEKIGQEEYDRLKQDKNKAAKFTRQKLEELITHYKSS